MSKKIIIFICNLIFHFSLYCSEVSEIIFHEAPKSEIPELKEDELKFKQISKLSGHKDKIFSIKWSEDSKELTSASYDETIRSWDINTGSQTSIVNSGFNKHVSPDLNFKLEYDSGFSCFKNVFAVCVCSVANNKSLNFLSLDNVKLMKWSPDSSQVAITFNNKIIIWNCHKDKVIKSSFCCESMCKYRSSPIKEFTFNDDIHRVEWSPDSKYIAMIFKTGVVKIVDIKRKSIVELPYLASCLSWSYNGNYIAVVLLDKSIQIIESCNFNPIINFAKNLEYCTRRLFWSYDNQLIASIDKYFMLIWDVKTGEKLYQSYVDKHRISMVVWSPCNNYFALCCYDCNVIDIFQRIN